MNANTVVVANEIKECLRRNIAWRMKYYQWRHPWRAMTNQMIKGVMGKTLDWKLARRMIERVERGGNCPFLLKRAARRFIAGDTLQQALRNPILRELINQYDIEPIFAYEVESAYDCRTAEENFKVFRECVGMLGERDCRERFMSIKLSALALYEQNPEKTGIVPEAQKERIKAYLRVLLDEAARTGVAICIDMECFIYKDATFQIFTELLEECPNYADYLTMAFQCYLQDSFQDAWSLSIWAGEFYKKHGKRIRLRLVKGANLLIDRRHAALGLHKQIKDKTWHGGRRIVLDMPELHRWKPMETPIVCNKLITQKKFIETVNFFKKGCGDCFSLSYGTMNSDTIAHIMFTWNYVGRMSTEYAIETLFGMHEPLRWALAGMVRQRVYVPYAPLEKVLGYMSRRFLEFRESQSGAMPIVDYPLT